MPKRYDPNYPITGQQAREIAQRLLRDLEHAAHLRGVNTCWAEEEARKAAIRAARDIGRAQRGEVE